MGVWRFALDEEDVQAYSRALRDLSRAELFATICAAVGAKPFSLTALKDHINGRCVCFN